MQYNKKIKGNRGSFKKGCIPWNKGLKCPNISKSKKGSVPWNKGRKQSPKEIEINRISHLGLIPWNKGKKCPTISKAMKGKPKSIEHRKKLADARRGHKASEKTRKKMRKSMIIRIENGFKSGDSMEPIIGKYEKRILDILEECFYPFMIKRQYRVAGYFLDGYCPAFNLAIEVDEKYHLNKEQLQKDVYREKQIKNKLNCEFLRINLFPSI